MPGIIGALGLRAERWIVDTLRERRAFSSSTAVPLEVGGGIARRRMQRLLDARVVHETQPGRYWLEESKWEGWAARRRRAKLLALALLAAGVGALLLLR